MNSESIESSISIKEIDTTNEKSGVFSRIGNRKKKNSKKKMLEWARINPHRKGN